METTPEKLTIFANLIVLQIKGCYLIVAGYLLIVAAIL